MQEFSVEELAKALFRQYLIQNRFTKTYEAFETEEGKASSTKIPKAALIKNLCMEHLIHANKKLQKPLRSLAEILISYLKNKYLNRVKENENGVNAQQHNLDPPVNEVKTTPAYVPTVKTTPAAAQNPEIGGAPSRMNGMLKLKSKNPESAEIRNQQEAQKQTSKIVSQPISKETQPAKTDQPQKQENANLSQPSSSPVILTTAATTTDNNEASIPVVKQDPPSTTTNTGQKKIMMFGKRKQAKEQEPQKEHHIFKNTPLEEEEKKKVLQYRQLDLNTIELDVKSPVEYSYKKPVASRQPAKKKEKVIGYELAQKVRKLLFQGQDKGLPKSWNQGVILSKTQNTYYGLQQIEGGPCGIVAALQCYYLKHLIYSSTFKAPITTQSKEICALYAMADMLYKMNSEKVTLAVTNNTVFSLEPISIEDVEVITFAPKSVENLYELIFPYKTVFMGKANHGYTLLLYSCILTKQVEKIEQEMDNKEAALIGNHGHCTQQLVNMFLTGVACSNCFDGVRIMGEGTDQIKLKGVTRQQEFGFLTIFEYLQYIEVGKYLKNPIYPVWIICKEFHYHVVFSTHYLVSQDNKSPKFDLIYYDGLYNPADKIVITLTHTDQAPVKKDMAMIQQVLSTKWGHRLYDWHDSIRIL